MPTIKIGLATQSTTAGAAANKPYHNLEYTTPKFTPTSTPSLNGKRITALSIHYYIRVVNPNTFYRTSWKGLGPYDNGGNLASKDYGSGYEGWDSLAVNNTGYSLAISNAINKYSSISAGSGGQPAGMFTIFTEFGGYAPYLMVTYDNGPFTATGRYPEAGARVVATKNSRFGWTLSADNATIYGPLTQQSGTFRWRRRGQATVYERALGTSGATGYIDIPAGTFPVGDIEWQVTLTSNGGYTHTSSWIAVNTDDAVPEQAVGLSPKATVVEDIDGVRFDWSHSIETGTQQGGYQIQASLDQGSSWQPVKEEFTAQQWTIVAHNGTPTGSILWRVCTQNSTNTAYGPWSAAIGVVVRAAPDKPHITYVGDKPQITVRWQSTNQQAYRVVIGEHDTGMLYGGVKEYTLPKFLPDGEYEVKVSIQNDTGRESPQASALTTVVNKRGELFALQIKSKHDLIQLVWEVAENATHYFIERDGVPIARIENGQEMRYVDYFACGKHSYRVRAVDAEGYYTMSAEAIEISYPLYCLLTATESVNWVLLKWNVQGKYSVERDGGLDKEYVAYEGRTKPVAYIDTVRNVSNTWKMKLTKPGQREALEELDGKTVFLKDYRGMRVFGTLDVMGRTIGKDTDVTFRIVETDYSEVVPYL